MYIKESYRELHKKFSTFTHVSEDRFSLLSIMVHSMVTFQTQKYVVYICDFSVTCRNKFHLTYEFGSMIRSGNVRLFRVSLLLLCRSIYFICKPIKLCFAMKYFWHEYHTVNFVHIIGCYYEMTVKYQGSGIHLKSTVHIQTVHFPVVLQHALYTYYSKSQICINTAVHWPVVLQHAS